MRALYHASKGIYGAGTLTVEHSCGMLPARRYPLKRRTFLSLSAAGAAAALGSPYLRSRGHAATFGEFPTGTENAMLPVASQAKNVLEVFLYGGLSIWETLYLVEEYGSPGDPNFPYQQYYTFSGGGSASVNAALSACNFPDGEPIGQFFAQDANGADVKLGPFAYRLRQRSDVVDRMRIAVQFHSLEPHEAAVPQALTGKPVGQPSAAGLGSHIQRFFIDQASKDRKSPFSYVFATGGLAGDNVSAAASTGMHIGQARPLFIKTDNATRLIELLSRTELGSVDARAKYDQLMNVYIDRYNARLQWNGAGEPLRSSRFEQLHNAAGTVANVDAISNVMDASLFDDLSGSACLENGLLDIPGMGLRAARHLLTHPVEPARYVCVSDIGLREASGGGGYDTHTENSYVTARNFDNLMRNLLGIINQPGENDPTKLNLDDTLIILNTEFGRTAYAQGMTGRNHHPYGYVSVYIGGPITSAQQGIYGAIGPNSVASTYITPAENRIAALLAMGIWPFSPEAFAVSDVRGAATELDAALKVTERVLGYTL